MSESRRLGIILAPACMVVATATNSMHAQAEPSGLVGWWKLNESSGTAAADSSGNNLTGTLVNFGGVAGQVGHAVDFDGVDERVNLGNPTVLQLTGAMTVAAWVRVDSIASIGRIVTKGWIAIGTHLKQVTTVTNPCLARRLHMGDPDGVSRYCSECRSGGRPEAAGLMAKLTEIRV